MTEVCTTPSRTGTAIEPTPAKPKRREVEHLFWVKNMEAAEVLGVQCRALCGHWQFLNKGAEGAERNVLDSVGNLIPLPEPDDCKNCLRVWVANARRRYDWGLS